MTKSREFKVEVNAVSKSQVGLAGIGFERSKRKWFHKFRSEPNFSHKFQVWMHRLMKLDKRNDEYLERVTNPETGEVVHECSEPLSKHVGHGSAKQKKDKF